MSIESVEELDATLAILEQQIPRLNTIQNIFWRTTAQCQVLLKQTPAPNKPVKVTSSVKRFTPDGLFFLDCIYFYTNLPEKTSRNLKVTIKPVGKSAFSIKLFLPSTSDSFCFGHARSFCEWFEISSSVILDKPLISKVSIFGCDLSQLDEYTKDITSIIDLRSKIEEFKNNTKKELADLNEEITKSSEHSDDIQNEISAAQELIDNLNKETTTLKTKNAEEQEKLNKLKTESNITSEKTIAASNNVTQLTQTAKKLNEEISDLNKNLSKLTNDKNLISDEYGPYVKEGKSQALIYILIVTLPLLTILFSVYELYAGASKILTSEHSSLSEVAGAFILRVPFAAVFGLAVYYSWRLTTSIIQRIFTIHGDRLALAKLLVLTREATHSSAKNLNLPSEVIYQEQLKLKVEVLKSHLSKDLGKDFEYTPNTEPPIPQKQPKKVEPTNDNTAPLAEPPTEKDQLDH